MKRSKLNKNCNNENENNNKSLMKENKYERFNKNQYQNAKVDSKKQQKP